HAHQQTHFHTLAHTHTHAHISPTAVKTAKTQSLNGDYCNSIPLHEKIMVMLASCTKWGNILSLRVCVCVCVCVCVSVCVCVCVCERKRAHVYSPHTTRF